jgi:hypothetical protein
MALIHRSIRVALSFGLVVGLLSPAMAEGSLPSINASDLAQGPYSYMSMLLEKTILRIDVATIEVRVDKPTQTQLAALARGQAYSDKLEQDLAGVAFGAQRAVVQMRFKRDVSMKRWVGVLHDNLEQAREARLIASDLEKRIGQQLPQRLAALKERGFEKEDRFIYSVTADAVQIAVISKGGQVLANFTEKDKGARRAVMACYFAPGSDYREPLLRSLVGGKR